MKRHDLEMTIGALNSANVRYLVIGGVAVVVHGYVRATLDVDLWIEPDAEARLRAVKALSALGYRPHLPLPFESYANAEQVAQWREEKNLLEFSVKSPDRPETALDLFVGDTVDFASAYARSRREEIAPGLLMTVVPLADLIEMKRRPGRPLDRIDLEALEIIDSSDGPPIVDPEDESTWPWTPEQQRRDQILRQVELPIGDKLDWVEYAQELANRFGARRREDLGKTRAASE